MRLFDETLLQCSTNETVFRIRDGALGILLQFLLDELFAPFCCCLDIVEVRKTLAHLDDLLVVLKHLDGEKASGIIEVRLRIHTYLFFHLVDILFKKTSMIHVDMSESVFASLVDSNDSRKELFHTFTRSSKIRNYQDKIQIIGQD